MTKADYIWKASYRDELRRVIKALTEDPTSSETVSSANGGSHSVTNQSLSALQSELRTIESELQSYRDSIRPSAGVSINYTRWC